MMIQQQQMLQQQQTYFLELYRTGMRTASDLMRASLENTQRLQSQQLEAVRNALEENTRSAQQLSQVKSVEEMMALQTRLAGANLERAADYWSRMWRAASDSQVAIIGQVQSQVGQLSERVRETYQFASTATASTTAQAAGATRDVAQQVRDVALQESRKHHGDRKSA